MLARVVTFGMATKFLLATCVPDKHNNNKWNKIKNLCFGWALEHHLISTKEVLFLLQIIQKQCTILVFGKKEKKKREV